MGSHLGSPRRGHLGSSQWLAQRESYSKTRPSLLQALLRKRWREPYHCTVSQMTTAIQDLRYLKVLPPIVHLQECLKTNRKNNFYKFLQIIHKSSVSKSIHTQASTKLKAHFIYRVGIL